MFSKTSKLFQTHTHTHKRRRKKLLREKPFEINKNKLIIVGFACKTFVWMHNKDNSINEQQPMSQQEAFLALIFQSLLLQTFLQVVCWHFKNRLSRGHAHEFVRREFQKRSYGEDNESCNWRTSLQLVQETLFKCTQGNKLPSRGVRQALLSQTRHLYVRRLCCCLQN